MGLRKLTDMAALRETRIYNYTDYRAFLKDALQELKERDTRYSHRFVLARLGVKSSGWLADVLGGRRNIARDHVTGFSNVFALEPREELYLETLVQYGQARTIAEKKRVYEKLLTFHEIPKDIIDADRFEYFSKWYYAAIREYLLIEPFAGNYNALARRIRPNITAAQAREALELLERLGFIRKFAGDVWRPAVEHVKKRSHFSAIHYYQYLKAQMELGMEALEQTPKEERDVSAVTLTLSHDGFQQIREEIKSLRQRMIQLSEAENRKFWDGVPGDDRKVFQAVFELFPVSGTRTSKEVES